MKKTLLSLLCIMLMLSAVGCGVEEKATQNDGADEVQSQSETESDTDAESKVQKNIIPLADGAKVEIKDENGNVLITENDIEGIKPQEEINNGVVFVLKEVSGGKIAEATENNIGKTLPLFVNGEKISEPQVMAKIEGREFMTPFEEKEEYSRVYKILTEN